MSDGTKQQTSSSWVGIVVVIGIVWLVAIVGHAIVTGHVLNQPPPAQTPQQKLTSCTERVTNSLGPNPTFDQITQAVQSQCPNLAPKNPQYDPSTGEYIGDGTP